MKTSGFKRDAMTTPAGAFGGGAGSGTADRGVLAGANPDSRQKRTPIVCASLEDRRREQVEHGKARVGTGADTGLLRPRRLS